MMKRILLVLMAVAAVMGAMADKKMTIRCEETGEEIIFDAPAGLRIYQYNANWLDSIPYLTEYARQGEPWAYEALGDCHLYGKGGVRKSIINALGFYVLAGKDLDDMLRDAAESNNGVPVMVFSRLVGYIEDMDYDRILSTIDTLHESGYHSADILGKCVANREEGMDMSEMEMYILAEETDPDAAFFAVSVTALCVHADPSRFGDVDLSTFRSHMLKKLPVMYSYVGGAIYENTIRWPPESEENAEELSVSDIKARRQAAEYFLRADEHGALTKKAARLICHYIDNDPSSYWVNLKEEDLARLRRIADIN